MKRRKQVIIIILILLLLYPYPVHRENKLQDIQEELICPSPEAVSEPAILEEKDTGNHKIRVALHNSNFESLYHDKIVVYSNEDLVLEYLQNNRMKKETLKKEKEHTITKSCSIHGSNPEERIKIMNIERSQGIPSYRGSLEIYSTDRGLIVVNELPLEQYLYAVVPSEMPATFPKESLKAQAVSARTFAYGFLEHPGLNTLHANVDDSVHFQVYNNHQENEITTTCVKETTGEMLFQEEAPVQTFYYAASCGYRREDGDFEQYITCMNRDDYDSQNAWYRWQYRVESINMEMLKLKLQECGIHDTDFKEIREISCNKRNNSGRIEELTIETNQGKVMIYGEYAVRAVLNQGGEVTLMDGTMYSLESLLPSAFFVLETEQKKNKVTGYLLRGGGFGHGKGLSQNGAAAMARCGKTYRDILMEYYQDSELRKIY